MTIKYLKIDERKPGVWCSCGDAYDYAEYTVEIHWWIVEHLVNGCKAPLTEEMKAMFNRSLEGVEIHETATEG